MIKKQAWRVALDERNAKILRLRASGMSWAKIADEVGLTAQACYVIHKLSKRGKK